MSLHVAENNDAPQGRLTGRARVRALAQVFSGMDLQVRTVFKASAEGVTVAQARKTISYAERYTDAVLQGQFCDFKSELREVFRLAKQDPGFFAYSLFDMSLSVVTREAKAGFLIAPNLMISRKEKSFLGAVDSLPSSPFRGLMQEFARVTKGAHHLAIVDSCLRNALFAESAAEKQALAKQAQDSMEQVIAEFALPQAEAELLRYSTQEGSLFAGTRRNLIETLENGTKTLKMKLGL